MVCLGSALNMGGGKGEIEGLCDSFLNSSSQLERSRIWFWILVRDSPV